LEIEKVRKIGMEREREEMRNKKKEFERESSGESRSLCLNNYLVILNL